jgi:hypothetical protein
VIFEELLVAAMWLKLPRGCRAGYQKMVYFIRKILDFYYFLINKFAFEVEAFDFFQENL